MRSSRRRNRGILMPMTALAAFLLTGSEKAFAAGADIKEDGGPIGGRHVHGRFCRRPGTPTANARKAGHRGSRRPLRLGGGCELALQCDLIIAADTAKFGQPEIKLGVISGHWRHAADDATRSAKAKAMDMILTGRMMDAAEAERAGLVARRGAGPRA